MTGRTERLREASLAAVPAISAERALLLTEFYRENEGRWSIPVLRASTCPLPRLGTALIRGSPYVSAISIPPPSPSSTTSISHSARSCARTLSIARRSSAPR